MKRIIPLILVCIMACQNEKPHIDEEIHDDTGHEDLIMLNSDQVKSLGIKIDTISRRNLSDFIETNGQLVLPPKSRAGISSFIGANIIDINVIEGDKVKKGQILASLSHPQIVQMQSDYLSSESQLKFLESEYERNKKLLKENAIAIRELQEIESDFNTLKAEVKGLESQLKLLGISMKQLNSNEITDKIYLRTPIDGYIRSVNAELGQYVMPNDKIFDVVNNDHIHAHFMVYEKDIIKVKPGQFVSFIVEADPSIERKAEIFSVGKVFESGPKAVSVHAELENRDGSLISGMYVRGRVILGDSLRYSLPEEAVVTEGNKSYVFRLVNEGNEENSWKFKQVEVLKGVKVNKWIEIKFMEELVPGSLFAYNNGHYLIAEMNKGEGDSH